MNFSPKVSIVIPVYNGSDYLNQAVDSALAQTYRNIEVVVVNDGSQDGGATEKIALSYGDKIRYFSKENGGVATALNMAIEKMDGEYFSWLSHDDLYYPTKIEFQIRELTRLEDRVHTIFYSDFSVFFGDNTEIVKEVRLPSVPPERFRYFITINNSLHGCTLLVPKSAFVNCGMFNKQLRTTQDYDLWFRLAEKYHFVHIPQVLVKARSHAKQGSIKMKSTALAECNALMAGFVAKLSDTELTAATQKSPGLSLAYISANLRRRGFYDAGRTAERLAIRQLGKGSTGDVAKAVAMLLRARLFDSPLGWLRAELANWRFKVKECLRY